jgi:non-heme chloroperoxidase
MSDEPRPIELRGHDGLLLRGDAFGSPEAPPVLLLHGGGQTRHSWSGTARSLAREGWQALSLDLRGHGQSDWSPIGAYDLDDFVRDLAQVARALPRRPVVVGASLGGMAALCAEGESQTGLLAAVVLVDVTPRLEPRGVMRIISFMTDRPEGFASLEEAADAVAVYREHRSRPSDLTGLAKNLRRGDDGRGAGTGIRSSQPRPPTGQHLTPEPAEAPRGLRVPTLLVRGKPPTSEPGGAAEFRSAVPHARFVDVSGAGHMVAGDRNDLFHRRGDRVLRRDVLR